MLIVARTGTCAVVPTLDWMGKDSQGPDLRQKPDGGGEGFGLENHTVRIIH